MHRLACLLFVCLGLSVRAADEPKALLKPTNLAVNSAADEDEPHVASNGLVLYFARKDAKGKHELFTSTRTSTGQPWKAPEAIDVNFPLDNDTRSVFVTPEGRFPQFVFFSTFNGKNYVLYGAIRPFAGKAFSTPTPIGLEETKSDELHPWLTPDGKQLYFSRKTEEGWRVFVASRADNSGVRGFGKPEPIDLPPNFHHATLTPDGRTMFLQGPLENGRWGLFRSTRTGKDWSKPEPLEGLNHPDGPTGDRAPNLNRDGSILYFVSDRPGGKGGLDVWWIAVKDLPAPKK
jgi:hypothetical protein